MNKKGFAGDIFIWIGVVFVLLLFLASWIYGWGLLTDKLTTIGMTGKNDSVNISLAAEETFGVINDNLATNLHIFAFVTIVMMGFSILIFNFFTKAHPAFYILYILIAVLGVIFSVYVSNAYEDLMVNEILGGTLSQFSAGSFIMLNLPVWTVIIGIFGAIFLFINIVRDEGMGGSPA